MQASPSRIQSRVTSSEAGTLTLAASSGRGNDLTQNGSQRWVENTTRIVLRPLASPLPLAFFAFGVGSLMTSGLQLGLIPQQESRELALIFGAFVFPPMLLCAVLSFFGREPLGATALGLISFSGWPARSLSSSLRLIRPAAHLGCSTWRSRWCCSASELSVFWASPYSPWSYFWHSPATV